MAGRARPSRITPEIVEREQRVLRLRRQGWTFDMIAKEVGYKQPSSAHRAYENACKRIIHEDVEAIRKLESDRLDIATAAIWNNVLQGDAASS